jgi:hypothetical protein
MSCYGVAQSSRLSSREEADRLRGCNRSREPGQRQIARFFVALPSLLRIQTSQTCKETTMNEIEIQQWTVTKNLFGLIAVQQSLISSLVIVSREHGAILRELARKLDYELPELPELPVEVDPELVRKMDQGMLELEKLILGDENPHQSPGRTNA